MVRARLPELQYLARVPSAIGKVAETYTSSTGGMSSLPAEMVLLDGVAQSERLRI